MELEESDITPPKVVVGRGRPKNKRFVAGEQQGKKQVKPALRLTSNALKAGDFQNVCFYDGVDTSDGDHDWNDSEYTSTEDDELSGESDCVYVEVAMFP
ncbi:hypothetical protein GEMRC1_000995 [Eukaryota sp. GEM-RC1]